MAALHSSSNNYTGFTSHLDDFIASSTEQVNQFVSWQKQQAETAVQEAQSKLTAKQHTLDGVQSKLLSLTMERTVNLENSKENVLKQFELQSNENKKVEQRLKNDQTKLEETKRLHKTERAHFQAAQLQSQHQEQVLQTTINDLTSGLVQYKSLGVDFSKSNYGRLKVTFRHLVNDTDVTASFDLDAEGDEWNVVDCIPTLDDNDLCDALQALNESNEMKPFIVSMRRLFLERLGAV